jgi:hypothetical protein
VATRLLPTLLTLAMPRLLGALGVLGSRAVEARWLPLRASLPGWSGSLLCSQSPLRLAANHRCISMGCSLRLPPSAQAAVSWWAKP